MEPNTKDYSPRVKKDLMELFHLQTEIFILVKYLKTQLVDMEDLFIRIFVSIWANLRITKCTGRESLIGKTVDCM